MTNGLLDGEPTFYLNDLAGAAGMLVSGVKVDQIHDEAPITTYLPRGTIYSLKASEVQKWFKFKGGKADPDVYNSPYEGDLMLGTKSPYDCAFTAIPTEAENDTTLKFYHLGLHDDYLGTLSEKVFGFAEGQNLFANVPELKEAYDVAITSATKNSNDLMNNISTTIVGNVDVSKKLAKTIQDKYPERYELKFGAKLGVNTLNVPNGHLGYDTSKPTGSQTTHDWIVYNKTAADANRDVSNAVVSVTLSDANTIAEVVMTMQGEGYKFGDRLYLVKDVNAVAPANQFIVFNSILDVQANTFNHSINLEDVLYSAELNDGVRAPENAYITNRLFLPELTTDASVVQRDASTNVMVGYGATVDVSCNVGAEFQEMSVTKRGYGYVEGNLLEVFKNNAKINHTITAADAVKLNLGVLTVAKATITSDPVYNEGASGDVYGITGDPTGLGAVVRVVTKDGSGIDVSYIEVTKTGSDYVSGGLIQIINPDNVLQTINMTITLADANLLNGAVELDLTQGNPTIDTKSFRTTDGGVPAKLLARASNGAVIELDTTANGTYVNKVTVRDGVTDGSTLNAGDVVDFSNIHQSLEGIRLALDASSAAALTSGQEYILDNSAALTAALTGGSYFDDAITADLRDTSGVGAEIKVTTTLDGVNGVEPIVQLEVVKAGSGYAEGDNLRIMNDYQTITKVLTAEDANLLNDFKELRGVSYPGTGAGNDNNNRIITTPPIFTDGAFGDAVGLDGSGAVIRVDTVDISDTVIESLTVRIAGSGYTGTGDVVITNQQDYRQRITLTISTSGPVNNSVIDIDELKDEANKVLDILAGDIPFLFYGGSSSPVQAVKNGVDNHFSEAVVTITCDGNQSLGGENRGAVLQSITLVSAAQPGTDNALDDLYYVKGDTVTFTVDQSGNQQDLALTQQNADTYTPPIIEYTITILNLTEEQADVLNGKHVGTNVPLLPGDVLVLMSTITSPANVEGQEQFSQSFLTQYHLAA
jgi:hypothetical protein